MKIILVSVVFIFVIPSFFYAKKSSVSKLLYICVTGCSKPTKNLIIQNYVTQ